MKLPDRGLTPTSPARRPSSASSVENFFAVSNPAGGRSYLPARHTGFPCLRPSLDSPSYSRVASSAAPRRWSESGRRRPRPAPCQARLKLGPSNLRANLVGRQARPSLGHGSPVTGSPVMSARRHTRNSPSPGVGVARSVARDVAGASSPPVPSVDRALWRGGRRGAGCARVSGPAVAQHQSGGRGDDHHWEG